LKRGLVIKSTGSRYRVLGPGNVMVDCVIKGQFRVNGIRTTNPVAVGDHIKYIVGDGTTGIIREIEERRNYIIRRSPKLSKESQIIASNIDQAILIVTLKEPHTREEFIDRFLVAAESFRIPTIILFNKTDIYSDEDMLKMNYLIDVYSNIGYKCFSVSLVEDASPLFLKDIIKAKITLVSGNSGVGKSTLLNGLIKGSDIKVDEISAYHKQGKHTTTFAEMYPLPDGGFIIDTPGIKGFGLSDMVKEEIYHFFPEIFKLSHGCRYNNCLHTEEPGCAVRDSVEKGEIEWFRYRSYLNIMWDPNSKYRL
jgi:ribosome biogenesis GTPase / thiamine phosphate phosphatase